MLLPVLLLACALLTLVWRLTYARDRGRVALPTQWSVPFLGRLPFMVATRLMNPKHCQFHDMLEMQHHPVSANVIGLQRLVVISGYEAIKAAFTEFGDAFSGRPLNPFYHLLSRYKGVLFSEGPLWREQRRFALKVFRDLGLGRVQMEEMISAEAAELVANFSALEGRPVNTKSLLSKAVTNVIGGLVFGERCGYEDPNFEASIDHVSNMTQVGSPLQFLTIFYPFLCKQWLIDLVPSLNRTLVSRDYLDKSCRARVDRIRGEFDPGREPDNYVEAYLLERHRRQQAGEPPGTFDDEQLVQMVLDFYIAGSDTTTSTLGWLLLYSALNPEEQRRCQAELSSVLGDAPVRLEDRRSLHRVQAFIDEGFRMSSILAHNVDRRVLRDTEFLGHLIPADAIVYVNLYGHHRDPRFFPEPDRFKPDRFLNSEGLYQPSQYLIPFGIGRRSCLGEGLARAETFLLFASLMQRFSAHPSEDCLSRSEDILIGTDGIVRAPVEHELRLLPRDAAV